MAEGARPTEVEALGMAFHKTRRGNDVPEFDLVEANRRAAAVLADGSRFLTPAEAARQAAIEEAARAFLAPFTVPDNGHCRTCHGYWPNDHRPDCAYDRLRAALSTGPAEPEETRHD